MVSSYNIFLKIFEHASMATKKITQVRSDIGRTPAVKATLKALGLGGIGKTRVVVINAAAQGMIARVAHLLSITDVTSG